MVCYNFYVFNRQGTCVHYYEWYRPKSVKQGAGTLADDEKQMFGLFWTLSNFCATLDPKDPGKPTLGALRKIGEGCRFYAFKTNTYKMHFLESPSGVKMVLNTSSDVGDLREVMSFVYDEIYAEYIVKNPLHVPGQPFQNEQFSNALNMYLRSKGLMQPNVTQ